MPRDPRRRVMGTVGGQQLFVVVSFEERLGQSGDDVGDSLLGPPRDLLAPAVGEAEDGQLPAPVVLAPAQVG